MSKQLNIFYEAERDRLYKGLKEKGKRMQEEFKSNKEGIQSFSIKDCLEWLKNGNKIEDYKPQFKI